MEVIGLWRLSIPSTTHHDYTIYNIVVSDPMGSWTVPQRYSAIYSLKEAVEGSLTMVNTHQQTPRMEVIGLWRLSIPSTTHHDYTIYNIVVSDPMGSWTVPQRYSAIYSLKEAVEGSLTMVHKWPWFPPKAFNFFSTEDEEQIETRRAGIEAYLQTLIGDRRYHCKVLADFLDPYRMSRNRMAHALARQQAVSHYQQTPQAPYPGVSVTEKQARHISEDVDSFALPPISSQQVPSILMLDSGEECFLGVLVDSMRSSVEYLWTVHTLLNQKQDQDAKRAVLSDNVDRMKTTCTQLQGEMKVIATQLLGCVAVQRNRPLATWLEISFEKIQLAIHWSQHAIESAADVAHHNSPSLAAEEEKISGKEQYEQTLRDIQERSAREYEAMQAQHSQQEQTPYLLQQPQPFAPQPVMMPCQFPSLYQPQIQPQQQQQYFQQPLPGQPALAWAPPSFAVAVPPQMLAHSMPLPSQSHQDYLIDMHLPISVHSLPVVAAQPLVPTPPHYHVGEISSPPTSTNSPTNISNATPSSTTAHSFDSKHYPFSSIEPPPNPLVIASDPINHSSLDGLSSTPITISSGAPAQLTDSEAAVPPLTILVQPDSVEAPITHVKPRTETDHDPSIASALPPSVTTQAVSVTHIDPDTSQGTRRQKLTDMDLGERVRSYEERAEKLVLLALEGEPSLSVAERKITKLCVQLAHEKESVERSFSPRDVQSVRSRLDTVAIYLRDNMELIKGSQHLSAEEQLTKMEQKVFSLLHEVNGLVGAGMDDATAFHHRIKALMKEMAVLRSVLRKKTNEEAKSTQGGSTSVALNRLEDLQENVADFEHDFCNRFDVHKDLGDKARDLYKEMKLREAQQKHRVVASSLFQL
eukprot:TRINITY_DN2631_c0_g1_i4.p1 TRINITY_DN2631_c0_g1~~TRINITY_DN2631_c0_g1_i4.p1  ORF type:complete len:879 (+),score=117.00 TRINITY_DN2631_c0_g1_i4:48-2639(+)